MVNKIYVFGGPGFGKTTLGIKLSQALNCDLISLDRIIFCNGIKRSDFEMKKILKNEISNKELWIVEGGCLGWCDFLFKEADLVLMMEIPLSIALVRIIKRHFKERKFRIFSTIKLIMKTLPAYYRYEIINYPIKVGAKRIIRVNTQKDSLCSVIYRLRDE